MTNPEHQDERLERLLSAALEQVPPRPAPLSLESRVLGELRRRAALPWWRLSFGFWPLLPRFALVAVCAVLAAMTWLSATPALVGNWPLENFAATAVTWAHPAIVILTSMSGLATVLVGAVPSAWLYGGLGLTVCLYAILLVGITSRRGDA